MEECKLTIFTPVYNRAKCLGNCYESMKRQLNHNFIWIVIDDGSTDDVESLVKKWKAETTFFKIEFYRKENGGMYTAYNMALEHVKTDYWVCIDSDDWLADNAVDMIYQAIEEVETKKLDVCGIVGLDATPNGVICGGKFPECTTVGLMDLKLKYRHKGDIKVVYLMSETRPFIPMPEIRGEKDFNPYYIMLQMDEKKPLFVLNEVLCVVDYQQDGMSGRVFRSYMESPVSYGMLRLQYLRMPDIPWWFKYRQYIHYVSSWIFAKKEKKALVLLIS